MADPSEPIRLFTPAEATAALPQVRSLLALLRQEGEATRIAHGVLEAFNAHAALVGGALPGEREKRARRRLERARTATRRGLATMEAMGVRVKDVERGLVDFPAERDGEIVELCWLDGEDVVGHWHRVGEGFAGRRSL